MPEPWMYTPKQRQLTGRVREELDALLDKHAGWRVVGPCMDGGWYAWPRGDDQAERVRAPSIPELDAALEKTPLRNPIFYAPPNVTFRAWRETHGMSRAEFAGALRQTSAARKAHLICDGKWVAEWERRHVRWPTLPYQQALSELIGRSPREPALLLPQGTAGASPSPQTRPAPRSNSVRRRFRPARLRSRMLRRSSRRRSSDDRLRTGFQHASAPGVLRCQMHGLCSGGRVSVLIRSQGQMSKSGDLDCPP